MIPIVAFVGRSDSGKTTVVCRLVEELAARGHHVATAKHHPGDFEFDRPGKDSHRHFEAGARVAMIAGPGRIGAARRVEGDPTPQALAALVPDADILIVEGFKSAAVAKIEMWRRDQPDPTRVCADDPRCVAVVTELDPADGRPRFAPADVGALADFIEARFLTQGSTPPVSLALDGRDYPLDEATARLMAGTIRDMVDSLVGGAGVERIQLNIGPRAAED